jgi:transketolase
VIAAAETGAVLTVEEHSVHGGLGAAVAELLSQQYPVPMKIMGLPDENLLNGSSQEMLHHYGLSAEGIALEARALHGRKLSR